MQPAPALIAPGASLTIFGLHSWLPFNGQWDPPFPLPLEHLLPQPYLYHIVNDFLRDLLFIYF